jgi:catechol 2,3-dioxygenase-like lactoylglutathione lyase family enzyme
MSSNVMRKELAVEVPRARAADMKLEVIVIPVSDVDRAKSFYTSLGWRLDMDFAANENFRVIQFTPPGSWCSIIFGTGITTAVPGSAQGIHLIVSDVEETRAELIARGVEVSEPFYDAGGVFHHVGGECRVSGPHPQRTSYATYASFKDPDGNGWFFQEVTVRLPGHVDSDNTVFTSSIELTRALRRATAAHSEYQKRIGKQDSDWQAWCADFIVREQAGKPLPT